MRRNQIPGLFEFIHEVMLIRRSVYTHPIRIGLDCFKTISTHTVLLSVAIYVFALNGIARRLNS